MGKSQYRVSKEQLVLLGSQHLQLGPTGPGGTGTGQLSNKTPPRILAAQGARNQARKDVGAGEEGVGCGIPTGRQGPAPALTFSRVPFAPVESARSLPARSTKLILLTCRQRRGCQSRRHGSPGPAQTRGGSKDLLQGDMALKAEVGSAGSSLLGFG